MHSRHLETSDLRLILGEGMRQNSFATSALSLIRAIVDGNDQDVQVQASHGYGAQTHLVRVQGHTSGIAIKLVDPHEARLVRMCARELAIYRELAVTLQDCKSPRPFGQFVTESCAVFVTELLEGRPATQHLLTSDDLVPIIRSIREVEDGLMSSTSGREVLLSAQTSSEEYYARKIADFLQEHLGLSIDPGVLEAFGSLDRLRHTSMTVVSDRSPANFLLSAGEVGAIDFGLVLAGTMYEDWAWFIDDPRLKTSLTRDELLTLFQREWGTGSSKDFSLASVFVGIKQYCLMRTLGETAMAARYLERVAVSAQDFGDRKVMELVEKIYGVPLVDSRNQEQL